MNSLTAAKILTGVGFLLLVVALVIGLRTREFTRTATKTTGTVIEMRSRYDRESHSTTYAPTFRFQDAQGGEHTADSDIYTYPPQFHVGERVEVLFRPDAPDSARLNTFGQLWGPTTLVGIFGGALFAIGLGLLYRAKFSDRSEP